VSIPQQIKPIPRYEELAFTADQPGAIAPQWADDFRITTISLADEDPDGETPPVFTLIRYLPGKSPSEVTQPDTEFFSRPAVFFVHGMTDYFFHGHIAEHLHGLGFAVYGVDLRKCGRSWRSGQTWHHVTSQELYAQELSTTLDLLSQVHPTVIASGHSTGGLDVATWAARLHARATGTTPDPEAQRLHASLGGVLLNSPWLGLQFDRPTRLAISRISPVLAKRFPALPLPGGINPVYGKTLHVSESGRWDYSLELKPLQPRPKYFSWIAGVAEQIESIHHNPGDVGVPTLMLCSHTHDFSGKMTPTSWQADLILKPEQMRRWIGNIAPGARVETIKGAMHDVFLSEPDALHEALTVTGRWLQSVTSNTRD